MHIANDAAYPDWTSFMRSNHHFSSEDIVPSGSILHHFHEIPVHNHFRIAVESRIEIASFLNLDAEDIEIMFIHIICVTDVEQLTVFAGKPLPGKVAVKLHSGEEGNQNFLKPEFWKPMIEAVNGTVVECNTAYEGARNTT